MTHREKKSVILFFAMAIFAIGFWFSAVKGGEARIFQYLQGFFSFALIMSIFLALAIDPTYSDDFEFEKKLLTRENLKLDLEVTPIWKIARVKILKNRVIFTLVKKGCLPYIDYPLKLTRSFRLNLLIFSNEICYGRNYEQIPAGGVGIAVISITSDTIVIEVIKRKNKHPFCKTQNGCF